MRQDILPFRGKYAKLRIVRKNRIKEKAAIFVKFDISTFECYKPFDRENFKNCQKIY